MPLVRKPAQAARSIRNRASPRFSPGSPLRIPKGVGAPPGRRPSCPTQRRRSRRRCRGRPIPAFAKRCLPAWRVSAPATASPAMLPMLRSDDAALRTGALDALRSSVIATHELLPLLLNDRDVDVRILSCELARGLPSDEASRSLCALLDREVEINVCAAAVEVLAEVGNHYGVAGPCALRTALPAGTLPGFCDQACHGPHHGRRQS